MLSVFSWIWAWVSKTIITLSAIEELKDRLEVSRVLIIAPKKVAESTWTTESKKWDHTKDFKISKRSVYGPYRLMQISM